MGQEQAHKDLRRAVRRTVSSDVALNVLHWHKFLRRGFFGRWKWLLFGK